LTFSQTHINWKSVTFCKMKNVVQNKRRKREMTAVAKRQWGPQIALREGVSLAIEWFEKARQKNVVASKPPTLYQAYLCSTSENLLNWAKPVSEVFRWTNKDGPAQHQAKDAVLRLLAVAIKAHFFLENKDKVAHEPYVFCVPDLSNASHHRYGLIYRLEESGKSILVAENDLADAASDRIKGVQFPVVLVEGQRWFHLSHWAELAQQADVLSKLTRTWASKKERDLIQQHTDINTFQYGTLFELPYDLKHVASAVGLQWASGIKRWYLPLGFDVMPVKAYMDYVLTQWKSSQAHATKL
jgi:hypothetical protein